MCLIFVVYYDMYAVDKLTDALIATNAKQRQERERAEAHTMAEDNNGTSTPPSSSQNDPAVQRTEWMDGLFLDDCVW